MQNPSVFISYSHDSDSHKDWVYQLACELVKNGVEVTLDQWDIQLGSNIHKFMEKGLTNADRVLVVCTDNYNTKSNEGLGGGLAMKRIFLLLNYFLLKIPPSLFHALEK
ncbi:toll/interleukin-1 receptor domain-containing protein [Synechococcus sp. CBW1108]|uniref:toll/interleukin-1 receptor domain-containing protein n=1 Tax=Synechococcus sp. CBW1108 TaxID=1353147 RepID=UPI0018CED2F5